MPLFSPGSPGRRRDTSAGAPCRRAANRARGLSHRPRLRTHGGLDLIGGSEARVDFVYTRRAPAVCPRPAGRLTRADLPVHHRPCRSTTVPASGVTCGLCGRTECTERLLVAAEYPATTVYIECSGPCGGSTAPMPGSGGRGVTKRAAAHLRNVRLAWSCAGEFVGQRSGRRVGDRPAVACRAGAPCGDDRLS